MSSLLKAATNLEKTGLFDCYEARRRHKLMCQFKAGILKGVNEYEYWHITLNEVVRSRFELLGLEIDIRQKIHWGFYRTYRVRDFEYPSPRKVLCLGHKYNWRIHQLAFAYDPDSLALKAAVLAPFITRLETIKENVKQQHRPRK